MRYDTGWVSNVIGLRNRTRIGSRLRYIRQRIERNAVTRNAKPFDISDGFINGLAMPMRIKIMAMATSTSESTRSTEELLARHALFMQLAVPAVA
jgi:hypothetical protein